MLGIGNQQLHQNMGDIEVERYPSSHISQNSWVEQRATCLRDIYRDRADTLSNQLISSFQANQQGFRDSVTSVRTALSVAGRRLERVVIDRNQRVSDQSGHNLDLLAWTVGAAGAFLGTWGGFGHFSSGESPDDKLKNEMITHTIVSACSAASLGLIALKRFGVFAKSHNLPEPDFMERILNHAEFPLNPLYRKLSTDRKSTLNESLKHNFIADISNGSVRLYELRVVQSFDLMINDLFSLYCEQIEDSINEAYHLSYDKDEDLNYFRDIARFENDTPFRRSDSAHDRICREFSIEPVDQPSGSIFSLDRNEMVRHFEAFLLAINIDYAVSGKDSKVRNFIARRIGDFGENSIFSEITRPSMEVPKEDSLMGKLNCPRRNRMSRELKDWSNKILSHFPRP